MSYQNKEEFKEAFRKWLLENLNRKQLSNMGKFPAYVLNCYIKDLVTQWKQTGKKLYTLPGVDSKTGEDINFDWE